VIINESLEQGKWKCEYRWIVSLSQNMVWIIVYMWNITIMGEVQNVQDMSE
jgi:hypothetical protein